MNSYDEAEMAEFIVVVPDKKFMVLYIILKSIMHIQNYILITEES